MAYKIQTRVVVLDEGYQNYATGTIVGYTTFEVDGPNDTVECNHFYIVELDNVVDLSNPDTGRPDDEMSILHLVVPEDRLRRHMS